MAQFVEQGSQAALYGFEPSSVDAVRGLNDFAAFLDVYELPEATQGTSLSDVATIALAWAALALMFYFPAMQVIAITAVAIFLGVRSVARRVRPQPANLALRQARI